MRGYTLIELLVAISIMAIIFGVGFAAYRGFARRQALTQAAGNLREDLRLAQQKALSGEKPAGCSGTLAGYLVEVASSAYTIKARCSADITVKGPVDFLSGITKCGATQTVLFKVLGQGTGLTGDLTMTLKGTGTCPGPATVTVTKSGEIK